MIIGDCCLDIWDGREQCLPGGDVSLIKGHDGIVGASDGLPQHCNSTPVFD